MGKMKDCEALELGGYLKGNRWGVIVSVCESDSSKRICFDLYMNPCLSFLGTKNLRISNQSGWNISVSLHSAKRGWQSLRFGRQSSVNKHVGRGFHL